MYLFGLGALIAFTRDFFPLQQISAIDAVKIENVQSAAAAAVASRPEAQLRVPFGQLLVTLARWKFGLDALTSVERLKREGALAGWVRHMLAVRLQCVVRGFLARRRNTSGASSVGADGSL